MSKCRLIRCGGVQVSPAANEVTLDLALWGPAKNVNLVVGDLSDQMVANVPSLLTDLLEVATYIFTADQAVPRGGKTGGVAGELWRRKLRFILPVREPDTWSRPAVTRALTDVLTFLSEDEYVFEFVELIKPPPIQKYLAFDNVNPNHINAREVMLFSGGLDSLAGACETVIGQERTPILVTHRSATKIIPRQTQLIADIRQRSGVDRLAYVPVRVEKSGKLYREYTQRTRSFLFACLAAAVARMADVPRVRFFENGVVSLNLPIAQQVVGARNTRTTHPRTLRGFSKFFEALFRSALPVDNTFLWQTKADIVKIIARHGCADLIGDSVSCTRIFKLTNMHTHCGGCSQCLDRRFATLAAQLGHYDPGHRYSTHENGLDLLTCPRPAGEPRTMAELYFKRAADIVRMDERAFFSQYAGEVGRAISHIEGTPDDNARRIFDLYKRHGAEVTSVAERGVVQHAGAIVRHELDPTCLLVMAMPSSSLQAKASEATAEDKDDNGVLVLRITPGRAELNGVHILSAARAPAQWSILMGFVSRWGAQVSCNGHRFYRLADIHKELLKADAKRKGTEESTRQHIRRLRMSFSEKYWDERDVSVDHDAVIQTSRDGKGYRLNPSGLAVEVNEVP